MISAESGGPEISELRRSYHDRIAALRERSLSILSFSVPGVETATTALLAGDTTPVAGLQSGVQSLRAEVEAVDAEVVSLLALESPVARDLRVVLAARDVAQIGYLCAGLCVALAGRAGGTDQILDPSVTGLIDEVSRATASLLETARRAWAILDAETALGLLGPLGETRLAGTRLIASLLDLGGVPMEAALDLAMATRAFDRLADHAEEIAVKVCFATGAAWPVTPG